MSEKSIKRFVFVPHDGKKYLDKAVRYNYVDIYLYNEDNSCIDSRSYNIEEVKNKEIEKLFVISLCAKFPYRQRTIIYQRFY